MADSMETKDNPLVGFTVQFQDGCQLGLRMDHPVPQVKAMAALGQFAAQVGMSDVDFTLPRQPVDLVAEAIEVFLAAQGDQERFPRELHEWSSHDLARAVLKEVMMPEPEMVEACRVAAQAIRDDLPHAALLPLETAIANYEKYGSRIHLATLALFAACEAQHQGLDLLFARLIALDKGFYPSKSGLPWEAMLKGNAAREMAKPILEGRKDG